RRSGALLGTVALFVVLLPTLAAGLFPVVVQDPLPNGAPVLGSEQHHPPMALRRVVLHPGPRSVPPRRAGPAHPRRARLSERRAAAHSRSRTPSTSSAAR